MFEHPPQLNITQSELAPPVADFFDNLLAQRDAILATYDLTPETAERFCDLHTIVEDREKILALYEQMVYVIEHKQIPPQIKKQEKYRLARELLKEDFLGIEAVEKTFNIHLDPDDIPDIPFTFEDLDRAKKLGQFLILRVDKTDDGTPLTMENMGDMLEDTFFYAGKGRIVDVDSFYRNDDLFIKDTSQLSWALVTKDTIPDSTNKDYLEQTECLIDYLKNTIYQGEEIPEIWQSAIAEFEQKKEEIRDNLLSNRDDATKILGELEITSLARHSPVEMLYDMLVYFLNTRERLFPQQLYTWTSRIGSSGTFIAIGRFNHEGTIVTSCEADNLVNGNLGVSFSRRY